MGKLIIRHSSGVLFRHRRYSVFIDGTQAGVLTYHQRQLSFDLGEGVYIVTIADRKFSVIETILITDHTMRIDIYPAVSHRVIHLLLTVITITVLATYFIFMKDSQASVQLLLLTILIPLYLVLFTSRKGATDTFFILVS